jgi:type I restriction enzyme S subunit
LKSGFAFKSTNFYENNVAGTFPVIKIKNVANGDVNLKDVVFHEFDESLSRYLISKGDVLIAMTGNHPQALTQVVGDVSRYKLDVQALLNQRVGKLVVKKDADLDFIYYLFKDEEVQNTLANNSSGSANQANISKGDILELQLNMPELPEQKAIAEVLSSLDDKIDLLHRQNKTLEQMAETLFRQWFVEEADESWEMVPLDEIAEVKNGFSFSSKSYVEYTPDALEVFKMGHIEKGGGLRTNPKKDYAPKDEKLNKYILNKGDIVMAMTDMKDNVVILGVPAMIDKSNHYVLNQRVARIYLKPKKKLINNYLLYIQLKDRDNIAILQSKANSGVQVNLSTQTIKDIEIIVPPLHIQTEKGKIITDLYLKKENNDNQIHTLEKLRNILLPKLMSGEVSLKSN